MIEVQDILSIIICLGLLTYGLMEIDHWFPFRRLLFHWEKFIDYEIYETPPERFYFYYKDNKGLKAKHFVIIDMVSIHSNGKIYVKGFDESTKEHIRFNVNKMSRLYKDVTYTRIWYPKEFFKRFARYGSRVRKGQIQKNAK